MTGVKNTRVGPRSLGRGAPIALAIVCAVLVASALITGPSLDDFWTLYLSDSTRGWPALAGGRWVKDIHPPLFNGWATLLSMAGISSAPIARLLSNLPALLLLLYTAKLFRRRLPDEAPFYTIFLLLMLSAPATITAFGIYRGDFWQLAAFAIQMMLARHIIFVQQDYRSSRDGILLLITMLAVIVSITLDYGGALFGGIVAMATMLAAIARGLRRWARSLFIALAISVTAVVYVISWQAPAWNEMFDLYQNWIEMGDATAGGILFGLVFSTLFHNPIAVAGGYLGRQKWNKSDSAFAAMTGATLLAALVAISQIDAQRRLITDSNTADIAVMVTALMAAAGAKIANRRLWMNALAAMAVLSGVIALVVINLHGGWQTAGKKIARTIQDCPSTRVYAASGWRLDDGASSNAARREEPVFALGYRRVGSAHGFNPPMVSTEKPVRLIRNQCPVLLWIEQVPARKVVKPAMAVKAAGLQGLEAARWSVVRTETGLILRAAP
ncbi:hypothetical protein [Sphingomonas sp. SRS2]|uniref:hypothetical protein n=1 Tax=Sphingomonas sp. SRS2 TaxID=133190 RepID=UPI0006184CB6|nr:hypothetical protein [Sphingomonas sp. SRS2]KKC24529.1 hypothetical protein WP12_18715 [Sphingomonas sp. SRS2]